MDGIIKPHGKGELVHQSIPNIDDFFQLESYEKLENIINNWLNEGDTETEETTEHRTQNKTSKAKTTDTGKTFNKIDDAFADLEGDNVPF